MYLLFAFFKCTPDYIMQKQVKICSGGPEMGGNIAFTTYWKKKNEGKPKSKQTLDSSLHYLYIIGRRFPWNDPKQEHPTQYTNISKAEENATKGQKRKDYRLHNTAGLLSMDPAHSGNNVRRGR